MPTHRETNSDSDQMTSYCEIELSPPIHTSSGAPLMSRNRRRKLGAHKARLVYQATHPLSASVTRLGQIGRHRLHQIAISGEIKLHARICMRMGTEDRCFIIQDANPLSPSLCITIASTVSEMYCKEFRGGVKLNDVLSGLKVEGSPCVCLEECIFRGRRDVPMCDWDIAIVNVAFSASHCGERSRSAVDEARDGMEE
ncbi:hypothetical protein K504DRAFT_461578 [Pleomassaria siparia CBS 279.74]|uniref:Uncharacterized protein n=1 Tax=Pleomassaria siparia CBS 279.74 TaxID=1314801 RepID=A0A6G1KJA5_9PLEO|nr:hypothetical protein K504DRAFT_461578 [Pleomassaria siparia CBS 279.74]